MDRSPPGSSVHAVSQARTLEWVACPPPGDLPDPGIQPTSATFNLLWQADSLPLVPPGKPYQLVRTVFRGRWREPTLFSLITGPVPSSLLSTLSFIPCRTPSLLSLLLPPPTCNVSGTFPLQTLSWKEVHSGQQNQLGLVFRVHGLLEDRNIQLMAMPIKCWLTHIRCWKEGPSGPKKRF